MYDVVTIGDCFEDIYLFLKEAAIIESGKFDSGKGVCFDYGGKIAVDKITYQIGGSAANTAINFNKLGSRVSLISALGADSQGEKILDYLLANGIDIGLIKKRKDAASNISVILSFQGDRTILTYHDNDDYSDFKPNKNLKSRWIYLAPLGKNSSAVENRIVEIIAKTGCGLIWNPGNYQIKKGARNYRHLLRLCNIIFLNREEAREFADLPGKEMTEEIMKALYSYGVKIIVITEGKNGSHCFDGQLFYKISASDDERIDATGAGDAFAGTFSASLISGCGKEKAQSYLPERKIIEQALKRAIIVSGSVVGQVGAHNGLLTPTEIIEHEKKLVKLEPSVYTK